MLPCVCVHMCCLQVDAFWCFVGLMERMGGNFAQDQAGMHTQLAALRQLVQVRLRWHLALCRRGHRTSACDIVRQTCSQSPCKERVQLTFVWCALAAVSSCSSTVLRSTMLAVPGPAMPCCCALHMYCPSLQLAKPLHLLACLFSAAGALPLAACLLCVLHVVGAFCACLPMSLLPQSHMPAGA
jgi:hypothetical protein